MTEINQSPNTGGNITGNDVVAGTAATESNSMDTNNNSYADNAIPTVAQTDTQASSSTQNAAAVPQITIGIRPAEYFYNPSGFNKEVNEFSSCHRVTGFDNLDKNQKALFPGLYALGAVPSLGKTTFASQMADNLAEQGEHVLYFSLEQTHGELYSKSISRNLFMMRSRTGDSSIPLFTSLQIRLGEGMNDNHQDAAIDSYVSRTGNRIAIVTGLFSFDVETLIAIINRYILIYGVKPVVIIDYLQIIRPSIENNRTMDIRTAIDHILHTLKTFQSNHKLSIILISSLNRSNYLSLIDFESFKESGGIEYTADVIWGLQLHEMRNQIFSNDGKLNEKREKVRKAKKEHPREIELVCLKNRFGVSSYTCLFDYYSSYDYFQDAGTFEE